MVFLFLSSILPPFILIPLCSVFMGIAFFLLLLLFFVLCLRCLCSYSSLLWHRLVFWLVFRLCQFSQQLLEECICLGQFLLHGSLFFLLFFVFTYSSVLVTFSKSCTLITSLLGISLLYLITAFCVCWLVFFKRGLTFFSFITFTDLNSYCFNSFACFRI